MSKYLSGQVLMTSIVIVLVMGFVGQIFKILPQFVQKLPAARMVTSVLTVYVAIFMLRNVKV